MSQFARQLAAYLARRLQDRHPALKKAAKWAPFAAPFAFLAALAFLAVLVAVALVAHQNAGGCGTTVPISAPGNQVHTLAGYVRYFESQGMSPNAAAGTAGNIGQESGGNAEIAGGGLAQWLGSRWNAMVAWTTAQGYPGDSSDPVKATDGQLMWIVYDLRTSYSGLLAQMNAAPDPGTAATMFETVYEVCSGVSGFMQVAPGSACNDPARRQFAAQALGAAGGTTVPASLPTGGTCVAYGGSGSDPIPGFRPSRDDMGVDACANPGMPIYAPFASTLVEILPGWYAGQPLMLFQFDAIQPGTYLGDTYWYVAEEITPASTRPGTDFAAGQPVATYAPSGTCIEIGWGSPTTNSRTLVPTDASPPRGALTPEAEAFKRYFHIPWIGVSP